MICASAWRGVSWDEETEGMWRTEQGVYAEVRMVTVRPLHRLRGIVL